METSVELQSLFAFSVVDVVVAIAFFIIAAGIVAFVIISKKRASKAPAAKPTAYKVPLNTRQKYMAIFEELEKKLDSGEIETRECCEQASEHIRAFASKMTGMDLSSSTLSELENSGMKGVEEAIEVCYTGEFPRVPQERAKEAIGKCKDAVRRWN